MKNLKHLINPNTISFIIGIFLMVLHWKIPVFIFNALEGMGKTTIYLSMLYIGALLVRTNIRGLYKRTDIYLLSLNKLLVIPVVLLLIINFIIGFFDLSMGDMAKTIVLLETGMPCMTMIVIISKNMGADDKMAAENVFLTTVLSLVSLPLLYYLIEVL